MRFEESGSVKSAGVIVGYCLGYAIFTTMLFLVSLVLGKSWPYQNIALFTLIVAITGLGLRGLLK